MNKKQIMKFCKRIIAGASAIGMIVTGIVVYPKQAEAAVAEDRVIFDSHTYSIQEHWNADANKRIAPVREGYVFGGWFKQTDQNVEGAEAEIGTSNYYLPLTEAELNTDSDDECDYEGTAYAKFVPAQVLSVKAQNSDGVDKDTINNIGQNPMYVRVMSSLDSANYEKVGFDIWLANKIQVLKKAEGAAEATEPLETTKIYRGVMVKGANGTQESKTANEIFGGVSKYVSVWQLSQIDVPDNAKLIIYVRPYWVTTDGTKVNGLAKYVHIEDEYLGYINVPVNLLGGEKIAAGAVNVTYNGVDALELIAFEKGRILTNMDYYYTNKTIKMVGNTDLEFGKYDENGETIYANLRFKKPTTDATINFNIVNDTDKFCDWDENFVDVKKVWDSKYVQTTTN